MSKPLKDTKFFQFLKDKVPQAVQFVGEVLPDKGALGILKNVINKDASVPAEVKAELDAKWQEFEMEILQLDQADRTNARTRELEFIKATGHLDRFMLILGSFIIVAFAFCVWVTVYVQLQESAREMFIEIRATTRDALVLLITYYWGSSSGSRIKDMKAK